MEAMEMRLREVGVLDHDIRTRLDGPDKALVVTHKELVYADESHVQRADLREITKVATTSSGALTVRTVGGPGIEGSIRGFDVTELKFFFESVKTSVAQAKATLSSVRNTSASADPWGDNPIVPLRSNNGLSSGVSSITNPTPNGLGSGLNRSTDSELRTDAKPERHTLELPPLDPPSLNAPDLGGGDLNGVRFGSSGHLTEASNEVVLGHNTDAGVSGRTIENLPGVPDLNNLGGLGRTTLNGEAKPRTSDDSAVPWMRANLPEVRSPSRHDAKADALGYALPNDNDLPEIKNPSVVPSTGDWSGEVLDPKISLEVQNTSISDSSPTINPSLIEAVTTLKPLARWLRIIGAVFVVIGLAAAVLSLPTGDKNPNSMLGWVQVLMYAMGSFLLAVMSFGLAELLIAASNIAADVRATRRATIGH